MTNYASGKPFVTGFNNVNVLSSRVRRRDSEIVYRDHEPWAVGRVSPLRAVQPDTFPWSASFFSDQTGVEHRPQYETQERRVATPLEFNLTGSKFPTIGKTAHSL